MSENHYRSDYWRAYDLRQNQPEIALAGMQSARDRAAAAGDDRAVLEMNHWILQTLIFNTRDIASAFPLAVETAVEARKDKYADMQEHICIYQDLILSYMETDPHGHAAVIDEALSYMQAEVGKQNIQCRLCLHGLRCDYEVEHGRYDHAEAETRRYMANAEGSWSRHHHHTKAYGTLTHIAWLRGDADKMREVASVGVEMANRRNTLVTDLCMFQMALAVAYRIEPADDERAASHYKRAVLAAKRTGTRMEPLYFELARAYHISANDHEAALRLTDTELDEIRGKGQIWRQAKAHLSRCELLAALERLTDDDRAAARQAVTALEQPGPLLERLAAL